MRKHFKMKLMIAALIICAAVAVTAAAGINYNLAVRQYTVRSGKVSESVRIVQISDLHCCEYGERQAELLEAIASLKPDVLAVTGDIYESIGEQAAADELMEGISRKYSCFYVTGNHECRNGQSDAICDKLSRLGITVLRGESKTVSVNGEEICISGIDDLNGLTKEDLGKERDEILSSADEKHFNVLLGHRPDFYDYFKDKLTFDLILCGHLHGGQWRLPGIINGFVSPDMTLFPKFAGGKYQLGDTAIIVSRGLENKGRQNIPRIFNRPELVCIDITAA